MAPWKQPTTGDSMKPGQITQLALEEVAVHFEEWRVHKKNRRERIPERLWSEAIGLLGEHPISQVARRLRLSGTDLKNHQAAPIGSAKGSEDAQGTIFVEVDPVVVGQAPGVVVQPIRLELERPDGLRLRIESGNSRDLLPVVERFMEDRGCCN